MYKCQNCGREIDIDLSSDKKIQCPFCGFRIIKKMRPPVIKKVLAD
ncbi:MAG: DNA-directed RNA polymerase subunit P [Nanoarchaeota archaeon]